MYNLCKTVPGAIALGSAQIASRGLQASCRSISCVSSIASSIQQSTPPSCHADMTYSRWAHLRKVANYHQMSIQRYLNTTPKQQALVKRSALPETKPGPIKRLLAQAGVPVNMRYNRFKIRVAGLNLYTSCVDNVDCQTFFRACGMADTLFSWFLITELHVWMCLVRLKQEGQEGKYMVHYLILSMWHDVQERGKIMGVPAIKMKESLTKMVEQFNAALFGYDEGLLSNDSVLAGALWRNLFVRREDVSPEQLADMVEYVRQQIQYLETLDSAQLLQVGNIRWLPFKGVIPDIYKPLPKARSVDEELALPEVDKVGV